MSKENISFLVEKDHEKNTLKLTVIIDGEFLEMEVKLDKINIRDKIQLHKKTGEVLYGDLLQLTLKISKLQSIV